MLKIIEIEKMKKIEEDRMKRGKRSEKKKIENLIEIMFGEGQSENTVFAVCVYIYIKKYVMKLGLQFWAYFNLWPSLPGLLAHCKLL